MKTVVTKSLEETQQLAAEWLSSLVLKDEEALVVGLYGNLGAGKTAFTQAVARELGIQEIVNSPTFVIEKIYETMNEKFPRLIHIDAYRLEAARELSILGFEQLVTNKNNLILMEWPEKVPEILPKDHVQIKFTFIDETTRKIDFV